MKLRTHVVLVISTFLLLCSGASAQERLPQFLQHTVKQDETIAYIAAYYHVPAKDILMLNNFPDNVKLTDGQTILIRELRDDEIAEHSTTQPRKPAAKNREETAERKPVEREIASPTYSKPAEHKAAEPAATSGSTQVGPGGIKYQVSESGYHTVEKGQTFYRIALIYGLTVDQLKALNNMPNMNISVGQKLKVK